MNLEIDTLQAAASRVIANRTGAEAGCVTACCAAGIAITVAASMTGANLARVLQLPDTEGMKDEVILQLGHNVNFGGEISLPQPGDGGGERLFEPMFFVVGRHDNGEFGSGIHEIGVQRR